MRIKTTTKTEYQQRINIKIGNNNMLKITTPRLVKNLREDVDWMDCISRQEDDFTECSFNGLCAGKSHIRINLYLIGHSS